MAYLLAGLSLLTSYCIINVDSKNPHVNGVHFTIARFSFKKKHQQKYFASAMLLLVHLYNYVLQYQTICSKFLSL